MLNKPVVEEDKIHTGYADGPEIADTKAKNASVDRSLVRIDERQIIEYFNEGLKKAASYARRMGRSQENEIWMDVAILCDHIRSQGLGMFTSKGLSWSETLRIIDSRQETMSNALNATRKPTKKFLIN